MKHFIKQILRKVRDVLMSIDVAFRIPRYNSKVICIGYNKTGTSSLGVALKILGYRHSTFNKKIWRKYKNNEIVKILTYTAKFDSVDDLPWLNEDMIPILDRVFPGSKFIYLTRDEESWQKSLYNWKYQMTGKYPNLVERLEDFRNHKKFIMNYFQDKPDGQFLILDIKDKNGFKKLANFLGKTTTHQEFPHCNKTNVPPRNKSNQEAY